MNTTKNHDNIVEYINLLKHGSCSKIVIDIYTKGNCFVLCKLLNLTFNIDTFYFLHDDELGNHFVTYYNKNYYDIRGIVIPTQDEIESMIPMNIDVINGMLEYVKT